MFTRTRLRIALLAMSGIALAVTTSGCTLTTIA